eukprot:2850324-Pleurochrysis_carterae.AAC.1
MPYFSARSLLPFRALNSRASVAVRAEILCARTSASAHAQESDGAQCVFLEGYTNRDGKPMPMIVQKSDGGFMCDLATSSRPHLARSRVSHSQP